MAKLTPTRQAAKMAEARRLSQQGYTRRQINPILREKYGEGIRPARYTPIYAERVATVSRKEATRPAPRRKFRLERQARYGWLVERHFTDDEARRLSKLHRIQESKGVAKMVEVRRQLWDKFLRTATERGWSKDKRREMWRRGLARWYRRNGYITKRTFKGKKRPTTWGWYKDVQKSLPIEDQDDTPRLHDRGFSRVVTPLQVNWTKELNKIRGLLDKTPRSDKDMRHILRREESRAVRKIREAKRR